MSQFTAPAGILGRPDFSGDDYTLQAFQNLSNTLGQLATTNAKREVEQAYEYGLMVEQLGAEEAKNASEFGKLVDQGKVSNLANSWIEVGGQVGRAKKDFISWSTMAEENMNLSLDNNQFGLREGDNPEESYNNWKASVLADQRQKMNGAGYYYGKTFGGLMDKWESEFKPRAFKARAALQRDDLRRGVADDITDKVKKKAKDLPGLMSDLTTMLSNTENRGALGNEGYRKYVYDVLEQLAENPDTAVAANHALENMREETGLRWADHYAEELNASENRRDAASMPQLTEDARDAVYLAIQANRTKGDDVEFKLLAANMSHLPEEAQHKAITGALRQAADDFVTNKNPEGMEVLLDQLEDTKSPTGEPYSEVMGIEIASIRNYLKKGEEDADAKKLQKLQLDTALAEGKLEGALGFVVTEIQQEAEQNGGAVDISEREVRERVMARLEAMGEDRFFTEGDVFFDAQNSFFTSGVGTFASSYRAIGEDQRETGAEVLQQIIRDNPTDVSAAIRQLQTAGVGLRADTLQTIKVRLDGYYEAMSQTRQSSQATHKRNLMTALDTKFGFRDLSEGKIGLSNFKSQSQINAANDFLDQLDTQYSESLSAKIDGYQTMNPDEPITADIMATFAAEASKEVIEAATADGAFTYESPQSMIERIKAAGEERDFGTRGSVLPTSGAEVGGGAFFTDNLQKNIGDLRTAIQNQDASTAASELALIRPQADSLINTVERGIQLTGQNLSAYPISRLFTQQRPVSIEELERGTFDTEQGPDDISLTGFNYDPTVQPMFDGMADLESAIKEYNDVGSAGGDINTTRIIRLINTINKRAAASDDITGVRSFEAFLSFQKDLFEFRGYN